MTDLEITQEAERLVGLNEQQLETEVVATALRLGRQSDASFEELQRIDRECLDAITKRGDPPEQVIHNESEGEELIG